MTWLLRRLGIADDFVVHIDEATLRFHHVEVLFAGLSFLLPLAVFIFLRQRRNLPTMPPALRITLTLTRVLILLLLAVVLAGPYLSLDEKQEVKPVVAVLIDHSHSMTLPAGPFQTEDELARAAEAAGYRASTGNLDSDTRLALNRMTRGKLAHAALENARPLLKDLNARFDVRFYGFARDLERLGVNPEKLQLPDPPSPGGPITDTGNALHQLLEETSGQPLAGIILLSDGKITGGSRSADDQAQEAGRRKVPLFTVPIGSSRRLQDVAIIDVSARDPVTVNDSVRVSVTIESHGFDGRPVKVELKEENAVLETKDLVLSGTERQQIDLTFRATKPGIRYLTVHVTPQPEEPEHLQANNTETLAIRVSEDRIKVLYVEGLPRWDFRFLKNALQRDNGIAGLANLPRRPDIHLEAEWKRQPEKTWLATAPDKRNPLAAPLPRRLEQLAEYHTIVLGDVSPALVDAGFLELLDRAVREKGVGLIVAAGTQSMPHRHPDRLQALLPVKLRQGVPGLMPKGAPFRLELAPEGALHDATRLQSEMGSNQNTWRKLPPFYWCAAVEKPAPGATVLVNNGVAAAKGKMPLIAEHFAGKGKVMFVGTDETWRWRQFVGDRFFDRFWGQAIRAVARRDAKQGQRFELTPSQVQPGEPVQVELWAISPDGVPFVADAVVVQVQGPSETVTVDLAADALVKGRFVGRYVPKSAGTYKLTWAGGPGEPVHATFRVEAAPVELRFPNVDRPSLQQLANAAGGEMVELHELGTLSEKLQGEARESKHHREAELWDNWLVLSVLIFLYSLDVGLRRLMGLS